jgi:hypothetical protein
MLIVIASIIILFIVAWYVLNGDFQFLQGIQDIGVFAPKDTLPRKLTTDYVNLIKDEGRTRQEESLFYAVIKGESSFNPYAVSPDGAAGLMQLMPYAAISSGASYGMNSNTIYKPFTEQFYFSMSKTDRKAYGRKYQRDLEAAIRGKNHQQIVAIDKRFDPKANVKTGTKMLRNLLNKYSDETEERQIEFTTLAYHSGESTVEEYKIALDKGVNSKEMNEFKENHEYGYRYIRTVPDYYKKAMDPKYTDFDDYLKRKLNFQPGKDEIVPVAVQTTNTPAVSTNEKEDVAKMSGGAKSIFPD